MSESNAARVFSDRVFFDRVFFDIDTQIDFLDPSGALYVPGAENILARVAALNHFAAAHGSPLISTMDAHTVDDPEFRDWPPHCVAGTPGQRKPDATLLPGFMTLPNTPGLPDVSKAPQILLEKQALDCFSNVNLLGLLDRLDAQDCIVYGVVTEICVKFAAFGLLRTGRKVSIVTDAVKELDSAAAMAVFEDFTAGGGILTTMAEVTRI